MKLKSIIAASIIILANCLAAHAGDKLTIRQLPNQTDGISIATTAAEKVGFHDATPVAQRSGSAQAAVTATSTNGTAGAAADLTALKAESENIGDDVRAVIALANELRAALVQKGLIKGSN